MAYPQSIQKFISGTTPTKMWGPSRPTSAINLVVLHTMEYPERTSGARWCAEYLASSGRKASDHLNISDKVVWAQCGPTQTAWTAGHSATNYRSINIETTMYHGSKVTPYQNTMFDLMARVVAALCTEYKIPIRWLTPAQVKAGAAGICSHRDVSNAFKNGGHHDDPLYVKGHGWFIEQVKKYAGQSSTPSPSPTPPPSGGGTLYKVKVSGLNIRSGPGMKYDPPVGIITDYGTYTIVEERDGWGRLKSGKGWISLGSKYVTKVSGSTPAPTPTPTVLKRGSTGTAVRNLQAGMNRVFPLYSKLAVDGSFGAATEKVIKEFQRRSKLTADGVVGPATRTALAKNGVRF